MAHSSRESHRSWSYPVLIATIVCFGVVLRVVLALWTDGFNVDEYRPLRGVGLSLSRYLMDHRNSNGKLHFFFPELLHYWISFRIFGGSLTGFRIAALLSSVMVLPVSALCLWRLWPDRRLLTVVTLMLLAGNAALIWFSSYAMIVYGESALLSAMLFFLFVRVARGPLPTRRWVPISLLLVPFALFAHFIMIVPLGVGAALVIVTRAANAGGAGKVSAGLRAARELLWLLPIPVVQGLIWLFEPWNTGAGRRPDTAAYFFRTSGYSESIGGILGFVAKRSSELPGQLLGLAHPSSAVALLATLLALVAAVVTLRRKPLAPDAFPVLYSLVLLLLMAALSLIDLYPYGSRRYMFFAIPSLAFMAANGAEIMAGPAWAFVKHAVPTWHVAEWIQTALIVLIVITGGVYVVHRGQVGAEQRRENYATIRAVAAAMPRLVLVVQPGIDAAILRWAPGTLKPNQTATVLPGADLDASTTKALSNLKSGDEILVIGGSGASAAYPQLFGTLSRYSHLLRQETAPNIWLRLYTRT